MKTTASFLLLWISTLLTGASLSAQSANELRFSIHSFPKTFDPVLVDDDASETIRYLTGGVLIRINRESQRLEPELATGWKLSRDGRTITFTLRDGLRFSDGTGFGVADVAYTMNHLMDADLHSPTGDAFRVGEGKIAVKVLTANQVAITFPAAVVGLERLFDQVAIMSQSSPRKEMAVLGPYMVDEAKPGAVIVLKRNPNYWKVDSAGHHLPYISAIRLDVQPNRDLELIRFLRGEIHFINSLDAEYFEKVKAENPAAARNAGTSLDSEQMWFNQVPTAPLPAYKKIWFGSKSFRRAVSEAINRNDLARVVFRGHAQPAIGPFSPANQFWFNTALRPHPYDPTSARARLAAEGFYWRDGALYDSSGNRVEFSVVTNAGNRYREQMATLIQQDLSDVGIKLNVVTLDFPSLIERITRSFNYEACLLGLVNVDLDPNSEMNVWLSSAENHQWNPRQTSPATDWEADIDRLMRAQASSLDDRRRKQLFDQVQAIVWDQEPFLYLVNKDALAAIRPELHNVQPVVFRPQVYWNIEWLTLNAVVATRQ
ncbi:MAG: ABC transporter substrate-binding protein [Acidobacteria bacterium]|nr:ABC transporter substrate-binding protein [Acidobacteriota bacterium]